MPNRATVVEMSPTSHVVTIPTFSFHHHHHPPPPPRAAATAAIEHPGDCPRVGQPGAGSSMPRHPDDVPDDVPNDATSRHRPSSATTATSLPNGNSRRWGRWGRTDGGGEREGRGERTTTSKSSLSPGSFVNTRGDGGRGTTTGYVVVPQSSWRRQGGTYVPLCSYLRRRRRGPVWIPHAAPRLTLFTPPCGGCFFLHREWRQGRHVDYTPPHSIFFLSPLLGGCHFSAALWALWASRRRVTHAMSPFHFVYPSAVGGGGFFPLYK